MVKRRTKILILIPVTLLAAACIGAMGVYLHNALSLKECANSTFNHFRYISLALWNYHDVYSCFPPPGIRDKDSRLLCSWRQVLIPFMVEDNRPTDPAYWDAWSRTRWDDPEFARQNQLSQWGRLDFVCDPDCDCYGSEETQVMAITGPRTAFELPQEFILTGDATQLHARGIPADAILVAEVNHSGINWRQPGDLDIRTLPHQINPEAGIGISGVLSDRFHIIFVDGTVWQLSSKVPFETLDQFLTVDGAKRHDRDIELGPYRLR